MKEKTISLGIINSVSLLFTIMVFSLILAPHVFFMNDGIDNISISHPYWFICILFLSIIIHELIHGVFFARFAKNGFSSIHFGVKWKALAAYCHCSDIINVQQYRIILLMPVIILGFIPTIIGYIINDFSTILFGCCMIICGVGDFFSLWMLRNFDKDTMVMDHPDKVGFFYKEISE